MSHELMKAFPLYLSPTLNQMDLNSELNPSVKKKGKTHQTVLISPTEAGPVYGGVDGQVNSAYENDQEVSDAYQNDPEVSDAYRNDPEVSEAYPAEDDDNAKENGAVKSETRHRTHSVILDLSTTSFVDTVTAKTLNNV